MKKKNWPVILLSSTLFPSVGEKKYLSVSVKKLGKNHSKGNFREDNKDNSQYTNFEGLIAKNFTFHANFVKFDITFFMEYRDEKKVRSTNIILFSF